MMNKWIKKHFPEIVSSKPLTQRQFANYVRRDFKIHMWIIAILLVVGILEFFQNLFLFLNG